MKIISEHLGRIIVALACVALLVSTVVVFDAPISDFFGNMIDKETDVAQDMVSDIETAQAGLETSSQRNIYCWGDSLTASEDISYAKYLSGLINAGTKRLSVVNCGVAGENTRQIAARQGGYQLRVNEFTIPASGDVTITFTEDISLMYNAVDGIFDPQNSHLQINPVTINGVEGTLSRQSASNYNYTFTRSEAGSSVLVESNTPLYTYGSQTSVDDINIIFTGTNDTNVDNILKYQEAIVDSLENEKFIVIGLVSDGRFSTDELNSINSALAAKWGKHFLDAKTLMSSMDTSEMLIQSTSFTLNSGDEDRMAAGLLPSAYMYSDLVHLNKYGGLALAGFVYEKGIDLGYWKNSASSKNADLAEASNLEYAFTEFDSPYCIGPQVVYGKAVITDVKDVNALTDVEIKSFVVKDKKAYIVTSVEDAAWSLMQTHTQNLTLNVNYGNANGFPISRTGSVNGTVGGTLALSDSAFKGFTQLKTLTLGNNVRAVGTAMFIGCTTLEEFNFPVEPKVPFLTTQLNSTLRYCSKLTTVNYIPESVTSMNATFSGCNKLTGTLTFNGSNVSLTNGAISKNLNNITFRAPNGSTTYTNLETFVSGCTGENVSLEAY